MIYKVKRFFEKFNIVDRLQRPYANKYFRESFIGGVKQEVEMLKVGLGIPKFERDQNGALQYIIEKYEEEYCPSEYFKRFSLENELEYLVYRLEIDELIKKYKSDSINFFY